MKQEAKERMSEGGKKKGVEKLPPLKKGKLSSTRDEDVNEKTAKKVNVSAKTVQRARSYINFFLKEQQFKKNFKKMRQ